MIINHNMNALNAHRNMTANTNSAGKSMEKLSSGLRINRAGDDAAGLAISEKMRGQIRGLDQASRNAQDGISLIQTAEGALNETHNILQRMRELAVQSANDTNITEDRAAIQEEINALTQEIDRISEQTEFNKQTFQIGANANQTINLEINSMNSSKLGLTSTSTVSISATLGDAGDLADGDYTVKDGKVLNSKGEAVGTYSGKDFTTTVGSKKITFNENLTDGAKFTVKGTAVTGEQRVNIKAGSESKLSAGTYEVSGDIVLKDGVKVGSFAGGTITLDKKLADGSSITITKDDLGIETALDDGHKFTVNGSDVSSSEKASGSIETINKAIENVSTQRAKLGAVQNRLEHTIASTDTTSENLQASESRIRDTDMAKEMMEYTKSNILTQAAQSMLAQANSAPNSVLSLLQ